LDIQRVRPALALPAIDGSAPERRPDEWKHVEGIRYMDGLDEPLCWTDIFLHPDVSDVAADVGHAPMAVYRMIEERHNLMVRSITQHIDAVNVGGDLAAALRTRDGSPALKITRAYHDLSDRVIEIAVNIHPAGRFSYRMTILRDAEDSGAG
jgi:DNA-binding GntR family transcriptional regulator